MNNEEFNAIKQELEEIGVKQLWDSSRQGTDIVSWDEASEEARQQMRNAYQIMIQATKNGIYKGIEIAEGGLEDFLSGKKDLGLWT